MALHAFKAKEVANNVPVNAPVRVRVSSSGKVKPPYRGIVIDGYWLGVKPNPKVNAVLLDELNGWHWIAEIEQLSNKEVFDLHLEIIDEVTVTNDIFR